MRFLSILAAFLLLGPLLDASPASAQQPPKEADNGFSPKEIMAEAEDFFGDATQGLAEAIEKTFADHGQPTAYILGEEGSAALGVGLRYGEGRLFRKRLAPLKLYWQGPSVGWDVGGNLSKVMVLIYNLESDHQIFQRFPGLDGSLYVVAGVGLNYQQSGNVIVAPIRTGVGLRAGASVGYVHYTREKSLIPF